MLGLTYQTPEDLLSLIGTPQAPVIVDVCVEEDFRQDPHLIPGAFRHSHEALPELEARLGGAPAVIVCQKGRKLSRGAAAWLRAGGTPAVYLVGGNAAWQALPGAPRIPAAALPRLRAEQTAWVAPARPGAEALAGAWVVRRFVDRGARILFVEAAECASVAGRFQAAELGPLADLMARLGLAESRAAAAIARGPDRSALAALTRRHACDQALLAAALPLFDACHDAVLGREYAEVA